MWKKIRFITPQITASILFLIFSPVLIFCAALIFLEDRRLPVHKSPRLGKGGRGFVLYKLRTMRPSSLSDALVTSVKNPRITFFGKIFRRLKVDELPQLINIIKGDIGFIGPRPDVPEAFDLKQTLDRKILSQKPGIFDLTSICLVQEGRVVEKLFKDRLSSLFFFKKRLSVASLERSTVFFKMCLWLLLFVRFCVPPLFLGCLKWFLEKHCFPKHIRALTLHYARL